MQNDEVKLLVTVKPLEWREEVSDLWWSADAYRIEAFDGGGFAARVAESQSRAFRTLCHGMSFDACKATAQAHFEQRILSTLSAIPSTGSGETKSNYPEIPDGWQDIASAPKDGAKFDAWQGGRRVVDVYWSNVEDAWAVDGMYGPEEPATLAIFPPVIHWRPRPPSPANPAETQAVEVGK